MDAGGSTGGALDRAYGALLGLAIGDALGMPTQGLARAEVVTRWPADHGLIPGFLAAPDDNPISAGLPAGRVTDDTDQAVILGRLLVAGRGQVEPRAFASALGSWEARMRAAGSADLLGPSSRRAISAVAHGESIERAGRTGTTNGAAMRIAPVGVTTPPEPLSSLVDAVEDASRVTHNTGTAIAGASAVAAAVSAGIEGWPHRLMLEHAVAAARLGQCRGNQIDGPDVAQRIAAALEVGRRHSAADPAGCLALLDAIIASVGTSLATHESVPAAFALLSAGEGDGWTVCRLAASLGGDSDTIAAMAGAVAGAGGGTAAFPQAAVTEMLAANLGLDLPGLARDLFLLRRTNLADRPMTTEGTS